MRIKIKGQHKQVQPRVIRRALQYFAKDLLPRQHTGIQIDLEFITGLTRRDSTDGQVTWLGTAVRPRRFCMELDSDLSLKRLINILAHEMVHVKQFATGELIDNPSGKTVKWQGKRMTMRDDDGYWTLPWEIEAYGRQPGLYARFRRDTGI